MRSLSETSRRGNDPFDHLCFFLSSLASPLRNVFLNIYEKKYDAKENYQPGNIGHILSLMPEDKHEELLKKYRHFLNTSSAMQSMLSRLDSKYESRILDLSTRYWVAEKNYLQTLLDLDRDYKTDPLLYRKMMIAMNHTYYHFRSMQPVYTGWSLRLFSWDKDAKTDASRMVDQAVNANDIAALEKACKSGPASKSTLGEIVKRLCAAFKECKQDANTPRYGNY